jgi:hypothetical protein
LILIWPGRIGDDVCAAGEAEVYGVEGDDQIVVIVHFLEGADYAGLALNAPDEVLVSEAVVHAHALLVDQGKLAFVCCGEVVAVKAKITRSVRCRKRSWMHENLTTLRASCTFCPRNRELLLEEWLPSRPHTHLELSHSRQSWNSGSVPSILMRLLSTPLSVIDAALVAAVMIFMFD